MEKATEFYINKGINELKKKITSSKGSDVTLTNNEIKDIMKVITSLKNRKISLKGTTRKNFLRPLMTAGLPLLKGVLTTLARSVLVPLGSGTTPLKISDEEIKDIIKIVKPLEESGLLVKRISETIKNETRTKKRISSNAISSISC